MNRPMSLGAMLILLIAIIALIPMLIKTNSDSIAGFQNMVMTASDPSENTAIITEHMQTFAENTNSDQLDPTRDYVCRSLRGSNTPCPEGTFCDGTRQVCEKRYIDQSNEEVTGYYS